MDVNYFVVSRWIKKYFLKAHWTIALTFVCDVCRREKMQPETSHVRKASKIGETRELKVFLRLLLCVTLLERKSTSWARKKQSSRVHQKQQNLIWIMFNFRFLSDRFFAWCRVCERFRCIIRQATWLTYLVDQFNVIQKILLKLCPLLGWGLYWSIICWFVACLKIFFLSHSISSINDLENLWTIFQSLTFNLSKFTPLFRTICLFDFQNDFIFTLLFYFFLLFLILYLFKISRTNSTD